MAAGVQWRDRANGFFALSGMKLRTVTQTAGVFVGDVAKDAGFGVAEVAERAGTAVRARWSLLQQGKQQPPPHYQPSQETVQERLKSAATSTTVLLKRSFLETKEKVALGRTRVGEAAKRAAQKSRNILANIERWQKGQVGTNVFGVPLESLVQRQKSSRPIPQVVINCVDYVMASGLNSENIFKHNRDQQVVQCLKSSFEEDWNAPIPQGTNPTDVAELLKIYLNMLPEPLLTFSVYDEVKEAGGNVKKLSDLVRTIPYSHYSTLECLMGLLLRISLKSALNKMDAHSLAFEFAPLLLWRQNRDSSVPQRLAPNLAMESPTSSRLSSKRLNLSDEVLSPDDSSGGGIQTAMLPQATNDWSDLQDLSTQIPLDDEPVMAEFAIIEAVQCLIEQQRVVFADAKEAIWQESGD